MYNYNCKLDRVIDGDTVVLKVELGFRVTFTDSFRLIGINTPELRGDEKGKAELAKGFVNHWFELRQDKEITVRSFKKGKYRWLGEIWCGDECLNDSLLDAGLAEQIDE